MKSHRVGRIGEALVRACLWLLGYRVTARNTVHGGAEVDVIAEKRGVLHLVEVKSRWKRDRFAPVHAVDERKRRRLARAATALLQSPRYGQSTVSFDVAEVWLWPLPRVRFHRDAFRP